MRPREGDRVRINGMSGAFVVTGTDDPSLVTVMSALGTTLRVGERAIVEVVASGAQQVAESPDSMRAGAGHGA